MHYWLIVGVCRPTWAELVNYSLWFLIDVLIFCQQPLVNSYLVHVRPLPYSHQIQSKKYRNLKCRIIAKKSDTTQVMDAYFHFCAISIEPSHYNKCSRKNIDKTCSLINVTIKQILWKHWFGCNWKVYDEYWNKYWFNQVVASSFCYIPICF